MQLTTSKTRLPQLSNADWAIAIRNRYGTTQDLFRTMSVDREVAYHLNLPQAIASDTPTLVRLTKSYGNDVTTALLEVHITSAIISMGEENDAEPSDVKMIAQAILQNDNIKRLNMASVLSFFARLKCGEFKIYGKITPRKFMEIFNEYAEVAIEREERIVRDLEKLRADQEWQEHQASAISFEEYKRTKGYGEEIENPLDFTKHGNFV
jgi:hypothetical protein